MGALARRPPTTLCILLGCLDPGNDGTTILIASDLLAQHPSIGRDQLIECDRFLAQLLNDDATSNADLKGMLNRLEGRVWGVQFEFGADAKAARRYLEALRVALARKIQ